MFITMICFLIVKLTLNFGLSFSLSLSFIDREVKMICHIVFFSALSGDNILTAVNVARACGMILSHERVIFVHASPPTASSMASLQFLQGDGAGGTNTQETIDNAVQVCSLPY